jgi:adenosylhomocysteine nucleosidase
MDAELVHLVGDLSRRSGEIGGRPRYDLTIAGQPVVAVRSGMGMLNAASTTERVVAELAPIAILNYGCAGAHRPDIDLGDVVLADRVVYTAALKILRDGTERHTGSAYEAAGEPMQASDLPTDPAWLGAARSAAAEHAIARWPDDLAWPADRPRRAVELHVGAVASADIWTQQLDRIVTLAERHGSLCEDMEAAAIAHVAAIHGLPFLSVKDISNNEFHEATDLDAFTDFPIGEVGKRAAALLTATIERWATTSLPNET